MLDPVALGAWRRRAREGRQRARRPPAKVALALGAVVATCALIAGRGQPPTPAPAATPESSLCPVVAAPLHADVDGDGCDEAVSFADGELNAGPVRMHVGGPGDQITLGRWTCGAVTVALLRRATGEVFRFDGWARQGNPLVATPLGRVDGAVDLRAAAREKGRCDDVAVTRVTGPLVLLPARPVAG